MRMHKGLLAALLLGGFLAFGFPAGLEGSFSVSLSFFHQELAPHGRWVVSASLGQVWVPSGVSASWAPYTEGAWTLTDYGWTWVSYDPWGGIPCHYGTWTWASPFGWVWVPGTVWAPAWVTWAYTDTFIGWAPLPPSFALSVSGSAGTPVVVAATRYVFVPVNRFFGVRISTVRVAPAQSAAILSRASKVTSFRVSKGIVRIAGPSPERVEKALGRRIEPVHADAIRVRPTTLAGGGFEKVARVPVVLPSAQRSPAIAATSRAQAELSGEKASHRPEPSAAGPHASLPQREEKTASHVEKMAPSSGHREGKPHPVSERPPVAPPAAQPVAPHPAQSPGHLRPSHDLQKAKVPSKKPKPAHEQRPG